MTTTELVKENERLKAALEKCESAFGMTTVWPLLDVLKECGVAMRHLLCDHDCDHHGHEQYAEVECQLTDGYIAKLESALLAINSLNQTNPQPTRDLATELADHRAALEKCREAMNIALKDTANTGHDSLHGLAECLNLIESPNPQPTQDPL